MTNQDYAVHEGREFLKLITEVDTDEIDAKPDYAIEAWLIEMDYDWNGISWRCMFDDDEAQE